MSDINSIEGFLNSLSKKNKKLQIDISKFSQNIQGIKQFKPSEIVAQLDRFVSGQSKSKRELAILYSNHVALVAHNKKNKKSPIKKSNLFIVGESGSGKTFMLETLAHLYEIDILMVDATTLTKAGYVGRNVDDILSDYFNLCEHDQNRIDSGIIFIDEADKIRITPDASSDDFGGIAVQRELLKVVEGSTKYQFKKGDTVDTSNILWVFSGSFHDYIKNKKESLKPKRSIGVKVKSGKESDADSYVFDDNEMLAAGFLPEFVGRIGRIISLDKLTKEDFRYILCNLENSILSQYEALGKIRKINLKLSKKEIDMIIEKAYNDGIGARSLKKRVEEVLFDRMYT